jgi:hypothetical protein
MITLTPRKDRFAAGVAFAKKIGCRFDPQRKVWLRSEEALWQLVDGCRFRSADPAQEETREQYLLKNGLVIAGGEFDREPYTNSHPGPAQRWMGQASMDHPDSHF